MKSGIYKILNKISSKFYIGLAVNFANRWRDHKNRLRKGTHKNKFLQSSWNLHGEEAFEFIIIEYCERDKLQEREQFWMDWTRCYDRNIGYNYNPISSSMLGFKHSEETKEKLRNKIYTDEMRKNMSEGQKGKVYSKETKLLWSKLRTGRIVTEENKIRVGNLNRGKSLSEETKTKISNTNKGRKLTKEEIARRYKNKVIFIPTSEPIIIS